MKNLSEPLFQGCGDGTDAGWFIPIDAVAFFAG